MISPRTAAALGGCLALLSVSAVAQPVADGAPLQKRQASAAAPQTQPTAPRLQKSAAPVDHTIRPASAAPPERIQVEPAPGARPQLAPLDDPRSVEEDKAEPDATDR